MTEPVLVSSIVGDLASLRGSPAPSPLDLRERGVIIPYSGPVALEVCYLFSKGSYRAPVVLFAQPLDDLELLVGIDVPVHQFVNKARATLGGIPKRYSVLGDEDAIKSTVRAFREVNSTTLICSHDVDVIPGGRELPWLYDTVRGWLRAPGAIRGRGRQD